MSHSPQLTPSSPPPGQEGEQATPQPDLRFRSASARPSTSSGITSPTSTMGSGAAFEPARSIFHSALPTKPVFSFGTPARRVAIRSDPAMMTCFDPADKELYNLWAPK